MGHTGGLWEGTACGLIYSVLVGREGLLRHHGNLPIEAWQQAGWLVQVAQHFLNNLGPCSRFAMEVRMQLPCPQGTDWLGPALLS